MLTPEYLAELPEEITALYGEAEADILADMARRIAAWDYWIPAADWQYRKLREAGVCRAEILRVLSELTGRTQEQLRAMMQRAGTEALASDGRVYAALGFDVPDWRRSETLIRVLNDGFAATMGEMRNLTRTTAQTAAQQFARALDRAWMKVQSGAFSVDEAVRGAVKALAAEGVSAVHYDAADGGPGRTDTLETAVRRAVLTGVNQCAGRLQLALAEETGCEFMETTAHADARPEHALWQGRIVSLSGREGYLSLEDVGYGRADGIFGVNCRHGWGPWSEGAPRVWSEEKLRELNEPKYEYNGKKLTAYEASQIQRRMERNLRRWKRENIAMKAAGQDTTESAVKIRQWRERLRDFTAQTGRKRQGTREEVAGWGRSEASQASGDVRKNTLTNAGGRLIMKTKKTTMTALPGSIKQVESSKGGISRNYYDDSGRWVLQVTNNDHGNRKEHPFGKNGEHAHDIIWKDGKIAGRRVRDLTDQEREENADIL